MHATVFVNISYGPLVGKSIHLTQEAPTAEECLAKLALLLRQKLDYTPTLTFRPADGMIFCQEMSDLVPLGVLYREGYQPRS